MIIDWLAAQAAPYVVHNELVFLAGGLAGMVAHFVSKRAKGEISGTLVHYIFIDHPGATLSSVITMIAASLAAQAFGGLEEMKLATAAAAGFTAGWTADSLLNTADSAATLNRKKLEPSDV